MLDAVMRQFDRMERGFLLGIVFPTFLILVVLKLVRIYHWIPISNPVALLELVRPELCVSAALGLGGLWALGSMRGLGRGRVATLVGLQIVTLLLWTIELSAHRFFMVTGSPLDYSLLAFAIAHLGNISAVLGSELAAEHLVFGLMMAAWCGAAPWVIPRRSPSPEPSRSSPTRVLAAAALVCAALALVPPKFSSRGPDLRSSSVRVSLSAFLVLERSLAEPSAEASSQAQSPALHTHLKRRRGLEQKPERNLVMIILESTRARSVGIDNEPRRAVTPFLSKLADRSTVAERAYAVVPHTSKALVAMLCGVPPLLHMLVGETEPGAIPANCMADLLGEVGYRTVFFQSALQFFEDRAKLVDNLGYQSFFAADHMPKEGHVRNSYLGWDDSIILDSSREWLREHTDKQPFFATYLTLGPHHDYPMPPGHETRSFVDGEVLNQYLNCVHSVDRFVQTLFEQYKEMGLYENTVFVILGDHGEAFGEHGRFHHDTVVYEEGVRIPLLIHDPQQPDAERIEHAVNQLDLLPTMTAWLGFEIDGGEYFGEDMLQVDRERPMRLSCWYERRCMAQIVDREKFIYNFGWGPDEFYDLSVDPGERDNRAAERSDLASRREQLEQWRSRVNAMYRRHRKESGGNATR